MAVEARRPNLPIPTDSSTTGGSVSGTATDVATDISKRTDKSSYSVPDDGSPLVIPTRRRNRDRDRGDESKLSRGPHHSQTSLLIEYFEGGKGASSSLVSRPSVRVRVTPSSKKLKDQRDHQIQVSESNGGQKPVFSRRISLNSPYRSQKYSDDEQPEEQSFDLEEENPRQPRNPPFEIEFLNRDQQDGSDLDQEQDNHYIPATSDISSMPADSLLEAPSSATNRRRSQSGEREPQPEPNNDLLKTPARKRSRSLSTERIAHKVAEKLSNDPQERKQLEKTVEADVNKHLHEPDQESRPTRRRARKLLDEEMATPDSSLLGTSAVSGNQFSVRSGASNKSSINNPRLLETVEDAIRRLILPELKELKKDQKVIHNTSKFERDLNASSHSSAGGPSRDELGRRLSKHASAPDVMKPKVVLNKNSRDEGTTLLKGGQSTGGPVMNNDRNMSKDSGLNSPSEADSSHVKWGSRPDLTDQDMVRRQKSKGLRDAQKAARVGTALTAAALQRHESKSTLDHSESQPHSDSQSQTERDGPGGPGVNETELIFQKHNVAPMPLRSMLDSELTRDSLTSQQTATGPESVSPLKTRVQQSPSPISRTPNRTPLDTRYELGIRPGEQSNQNLSVHSASDRDGRKRSFSPLVEDYDFDDDDIHSSRDAASAGDIAAAAVANLLDEHSDPSRRRVLSPIQSVASEQSDLKEHKQSPRQSGQEDRLGYSQGERALEPRLSIGSLSSAPSTNYARSAKPSGLSLNSQKNEGQQDRGFGYGDSSRTDWDDSSLGPKHDDSELDYMDKVHQGQRVSDGGANNPQFVHPVPVESAVASLLDPSTVGPRSTQFGGKRSEPNLSRSQPQTEEERQGSPLKQRQNAGSPDATSFLKRMGVTSPPQSVTQSLDDQAELGHARSFDLGDDAMHDAGDTPGSESEINTNPSIIQGPGLPEEDQGYWNYDETTPEKRDQPGLDDSSPANRDLDLEEEMSYDPGHYPDGTFAHEDFLDQQYGDDTPSGGKDEGYASGAQPISPSPGTPKAGGARDLDMDADDMGMFDSPGEDPFTPSHQRNLSGYSHGAGSPLYDSATGKGVERIKSKDIIALMDHLTVRDAQRNARDTEILVSLVRSAAEMRTSFEEMKKFIANQDGMVMEANDKQHERTYRALGGPRPQPPSSRPRQVAFADEEEMGTKRQNVFKRALKGLSLKSGNDLTKIEDMLEQLLDEVEALRDQQDEHFGPSARPSIDQDGYEPEGEAGSPSGADNRSFRTANRAQNDSRPSTVPEADEEDEEDGAQKEFLSPQLQSEENPAAPVASGALDETTPPRSNEKTKKNKSGPAAFFPKISRWSKATGDNIRNSIQPKSKDRYAFSYDAAASRSGELPSGPYDYSPQGEDRIRSRVSFDDQPQVHQEDRPPSPLVPSQMSEAPKYRAHRDSLNLQHPQPRQGPTGRYQTQLETQAQVYGFPSPQADQWGSTSSVHLAQKRNSVASRLSPISDTGYSEATSRHTGSGPPRPPKVKDDGPLVPERPPKVRDDDERSYTTNRHVSRSSAMYTSTSPQNSPPARKLTGPRPLNSGSQYSSRRRRASPEQVDDLDY